MSQTYDREFVHGYELETWTRCAADYLNGFAGLTMATLPRVTEAAGIMEGSKVLDIGSGPGHLCGALVSMGCNAVGVDFSDAMVEIARETYPGAEFLHGEAGDLPFEDEEFDRAISNFVVHHLADPKQAFTEIFRVLKPGGTFAYAVFGAPENQSSIGEFFGAIEEFHSVEDLPHGPLFGVTDLDVHRGLLEGGGFSDAKFEFLPITWRSNTAEAVFNAFSDWGNLEALSSDTATKIKEATLKRYESYHVGDAYEFPHEALVASAMKKA